MAKENNDNHGLLYTLCALAAGAVIFNAVLLLWQILKLRRPKGYDFVKYSLLLLDGFYSLTALALVFLILYRDVGGSSLCDAGGYLIVAGSQLALWFQATSCVSLLLWIKKGLSPDLQRRNGLIFSLIASAQCLVIAIISALPFMNLPYFDTIEEYYYTCTPLRLPGQKGWAYSTLLLILDWVACVIATGTLIKVSIHYSSCRQPQISAAEKLETYYTDESKLRQQRQTFLTLMVCSIGWGVVLVITNITYFSKGDLDSDAAQWILGFGLGVTLSLRPFFILSHHIGSRWLSKHGHGLKTYSASLFQSRPPGLQRLARLPDSHQSPGVQKYLVQWREEKSGQLLSGTMKTFVPSTQPRWRGEIMALEKLGKEGHPNLARYLWVSPNNPFSHSICSNTGDPTSRHAGIICREHYSNGTLADYLRTRIHQLSEVNLHKITLDVANGLEFLHQNNIVHNGLTSSTVFMANISEKSGLKAVIGDLDNSYEVHKNEVTPGNLYNSNKTWSECNTAELFTISSRMAIQHNPSHNKFAPDMRAFGLLVLEMLVAMSQYKQKMKAAPRSRVSRLLEEVIRDASVVDSDQPVETSTPHDYRNIEDTRVLNNNTIDVRVHNGQTSVYDNQPEVQTWRKIFKEEIPTAMELNEVSVPPSPKKSVRHDDQIMLETDMCRTCGYTFDGSDEAKNLDTPISQTTDMTESPEINLCTSCQHEDAVNNSKGSFELKRPVIRETTPPKLSVRAFNVDKPKKLTKPMGKGQQQAPIEHIIELPEVGESDTDSVASIYRPYTRRGSYSGKQILTNGSFLTPRTTPELRTPTSRSDSSATTPTGVTQELKALDQAQSDIDKAEAKGAGTLKDVESRQDTPLTSAHEIGFQTIYEEDESQTTLPKKAKPQIPPKPRKLFRPQAFIKRRPPPPLPRSEGSLLTEGMIKRRYSTASLDESVVSATDSGLGSSHYGSSYCDSEISSIYLQPGSRNPIYSGSMSEGSESYCSIKPILREGKSVGSITRIADSGIESSADSCDEINGRYPRGQDKHCALPLTIPNSSSEHPSNVNTNNQINDENSEDSVDNTYEQLPDIPDSPILPRRKEKQPCVGHHDHLENSPCKHHSQLSNSSSQRKNSVTTSTQTTGSLERHDKSEKRNSVDSNVEWKSLVDKADGGDQSETHLDQDKKTKVPLQTVKSVQSHTVRHKAQLHQETVHSQPVHSQTANYPQQLQVPHLPPKQIYTQGSSQHYYEMSPQIEHFQGNQYSSASLENLYNAQGGYDNNAYDSNSLSSQHDYHKQEIADVHRPYREDKCYPDADHRYHKDALKQYSSLDCRRPMSLNSTSTVPTNSSHGPSAFKSVWGDHLHNLAYYPQQQMNTESENYPRSAFRKPTPSSEHRHRKSYTHDYSKQTSTCSHQTDEEKISNALEQLKREGKLGFVATQLMPLLKECYAQDPAPSVDDILHKLEQLVPSAVV